MEVADVLRYLGVFLGGGVSGGVVTAKLLDHWLADRKDRRAGLRPKDQERVKAARLLSEQLWLWTIESHLNVAKRSEPDWREVWEQYRFVLRSVDELDDRRLTKAWGRFSADVMRVHAHDKARDGEVEPASDTPEGAALLDSLEGARKDLVRQLNRLERRR